MIKWGHFLDEMEDFHNMKRLFKDKKGHFLEKKGHTGRYPLGPAVPTPLLVPDFLRFINAQFLRGWLLVK